MQPYPLNFVGVPKLSLPCRNVNDGY